jgi:hypothetical protein
MLCVFDASKAIRRSWRQNASVTFTGQDIGMVAGFFTEFQIFLKRLPSGSQIVVSLCEYSHELTINPDKVNRFYPRTEEELLSNYVQQKQIINNLLRCLPVCVINLPNYNVFDIMLELQDIAGGDKWMLVTDTEDLECFSSATTLVLNYLWQALPKSMPLMQDEMLHISIFGNYFVDKAVSIRLATIARHSSDFFSGDVDVENMNYVIESSTLTKKQKYLFLSAEKTIRDNYRRLTGHNQLRKDSVLTCLSEKNHKNKTKFYLEFLRLQTNFANEEFVDNIFLELNRIEYGQF